MAGTKAGGAKAAATNKAKHGNDFYKRIGAKGGALGTTGGFASSNELARIAGTIGGMTSRRGKPGRTPLTALEKQLISDNVRREIAAEKKALW